MFGKIEIWVTRAWISKWPPFLIQYGGQLTMNQMVPPTFSTLPAQVLIGIRAKQSPHEKSYST